MATIAELIGANPEQVQDLLDTARAAEEAKKAALLAEEAAKGQQALEVSKAVSSEPAEFASRKAQALSKQAKAAMGEVGEKVISDLPPVSGRMGEAMERAARAAAGTTGEGVIEAAGPKHSLITRLTDFADKFGPSALEKLGLSSSSIQALGKAAAPAAKMASKAVLPLGIAAEIASTPSAGADSDVTTGRQLTPSEMANTLPGSPVNYMPPGESSKLTPTMASSLYDSPEQIVADLTRAKEPSARMLAAPSAAESLKPAPRTIAAGEPTAQMVQKTAEDKALETVLKAGQAQESEYEDLLKRYKDAQERQRLAQLGISIGQAAEKFGSSVAMVKPGDQSFYEQQMKLAGGIADQVKEEETIRREAEKNNPKSQTSVAMRGLLKEQGINVPDNISAAFIEKQYPQFANILSRREAAKERAELRQERAEERAERKFDKLDSEKKSLAIRLAPKIQNKQYETLAELQAQKALIDEAVTNPNPQRDTTMFYSFVKALDPNSVVREGEIKFSQAARSIPTSIRGSFNKAFKGQMLLPEERKNIQDFMNQRMDLAKSAWERSASPFLKQADEAKIDRELVAPGTAALTLAPELKSQKSTIKLDSKLTGKAGKTFTGKNGKRYIVNPDETTATEI